MMTRIITARQQQKQAQQREQQLKQFPMIAITPTTPTKSKRQFRRVPRDIAMMMMLLIGLCRYSGGGCEALILQQQQQRKQQRFDHQPPLSLDRLEHDQVSRELQSEICSGESVRSLASCLIDNPCSTECDTDPTDSNPILFMNAPTSCTDIYATFCPLVNCCPTCATIALQWYQCSANNVATRWIDTTCDLSINCPTYPDQSDNATTTTTMTTPSVVAANRPMVSSIPPSSSPIQIEATPSPSVEDFTSSLPSSNAPVASPLRSSPVVVSSPSSSLDIDPSSSLVLSDVPTLTVPDPTVAAANTERSSSSSYYYYSYHIVAVMMTMTSMLTVTWMFEN
jgi:hypothetical protein